MAKDEKTVSLPAPREGFHWRQCEDEYTFYNRLADATFTIDYTQVDDDGHRAHTRQGAVRYVTTAPTAIKEGSKTTPLEACQVRLLQMHANEYAYRILGDTVVSSEFSKVMLAQLVPEYRNAVPKATAKIAKDAITEVGFGPAWLAILSLKHGGNAKQAQAEYDTTWPMLESHCRETATMLEAAKRTAAASGWRASGASAVETGVTVKAA
jgi:hypothetical protein